MQNFHGAFFIVLVIVYSVYGDEADIPEVTVEEVESNRENCGNVGADCEYEYERCCNDLRCRFTGRTGRLFMCL
uniref:Toxin 29 isoform S1 n=1 Tax=Cupiennius salei TaxID=6928 RepID=A0A4Y5UGQ1_CUPSA|nr:toxin 29 isoform S1 precursor [Cupiennius salei]QDC23146.1 toxin 29 isoform S2 precursor [Cupiennius salei]